jgi:hypothetical protein
MPNFRFSLRDCETITYRARERDYPDLSSALIDANTKARALIRSQLRQPGAIALKGSLDIEDEQHRPAARIMLAELSRQLS